MKRFAALCVTLVLALTLAACGGQTSPEPSPEPSPSAADALAPAPEESYRPGATDGATYTNDFLGLGCDLPQGWSYYTAQEIAQLNGSLQETFDQAEVDLDLAQGKTFTDMYAVADDTLANLNVTIQNLGVLAGAAITAEDYVSLSIAALPAQMEAMGYSDVAAEQNAVSFAGQDCPGIYLTGQVGGLAIYQQLVCLKAGDYLATVTVTTFTQDGTSDLLACFYSIT